MNDRNKLLAVQLVLVLGVCCFFSFSAWEPSA